MNKKKKKKLTHLYTYKMQCAHGMKKKPSSKKATVAASFF